VRKWIAAGTLAAAVCLLAGCSSGPSQSYLDGQNFGNQYGAGSFPASSPQRQCGLFFAQQNLGSSENINDWIAGCVQAIKGGKFTGLNNG